MGNSPKVLAVLVLLTTVPVRAQIVVGKTLAEPPFYKTSFDCTKAKMFSVDEAICKDEQLSQLDVQAAEAYHKRMAATASAKRDELIASQKRWLTIRNSYSVRGTSDDREDLNNLYRARIAVLKSSTPGSLEAPLPEAYNWLRDTAPEGFSKDNYSILRAHASCANPCQIKPALYRWIAIGGRGIGEEPGDIDTPYAQLVKRLTAEGWTKCRSAADDSGKLQVDHFNKGDEMVSVSRSYSMGAGNGIGFSIAISGPLPQAAAKPVPNPSITITDDWDAYSDQDVGLTVRFPPDWSGRNSTAANGGREYKYLIFAHDDFQPGDFRINIEPRREVDPNYKLDDDGPVCSPSRYRISGFPATECLAVYEEVANGTCTRYLQSIRIQTDAYVLTFEPSGEGSFPDQSGHYKLTDLYEKIMSTIEIGERKGSNQPN
jgi:uncharacterized protein